MKFSEVLPSCVSLWPEAGCLALSGVDFVKYSSGSGSEGLVIFLFYS